jgi:hypothetical protein
MGLGPLLKAARPRLDVRGEREGGDSDDDHDDDGDDGDGGARLPPLNLSLRRRGKLRGFAWLGGGQELSM